MLSVICSIVPLVIRLSELVYLACASHNSTVHCRSSRVARSRSSTCFRSRQQFVGLRMPATAAAAKESIAVAFWIFGLVFVFGRGHTRLPKPQLDYCCYFFVCCRQTHYTHTHTQSACWSNWQPLAIYLPSRTEKMSFLNNC